MDQKSIGFNNSQSGKLCLKIVEYKVKNIQKIG